MSGLGWNAEARGKKTSQKVASHVAFVSEVEKYRRLITDADIQEEYEDELPTVYMCMIWQTALGLNKCAIKENIMCIVP